MTQRAKQLQMHVEELLLVMNASKITSIPFKDGGRPVPLRTFDKAEPFLLQDVTHAEFTDAQIFNDVSLRDLSAPFDFAGIGYLNGDSEQGNLAVSRIGVVRRPLHPVKYLTRYVIAHRCLFLNRQTGVGETTVIYYGSNTGEPNSWVLLNTGELLVEVCPEYAFMLICSLGLHFNRDYLWHAYLKWPGAEVGVMIPTTPEGARALFRLRDHEEGASRRKALIHWVSEHSRRIRKDTAEETRVWVREHKRGTAKFKWQDMEGAIYPAAYDLRRLEQAKRSTR